MVATKVPSYRVENGEFDPSWLDLGFGGAPILSPEAPNALFSTVSERFLDPQSAETCWGFYNQYSSLQSNLKHGWFTRKFANHI